MGSQNKKSSKSKKSSEPKEEKISEEPKVEKINEEFKPGKPLPEVSPERKKAESPLRKKIGRPRDPLTRAEKYHHYTANFPKYLFAYLQSAIYRESGPDRMYTYQDYLNYLVEKDMVENKKTGNREKHIAKFYKELRKEEAPKK